MDFFGFYQALKILSIQLKYSYKEALTKKLDI